MLCWDIHYLLEVYHNYMRHCVSSNALTNHSPSSYDSLPASSQCRNSCITLAPTSLHVMTLSHVVLHTAMGLLVSCCSVLVYTWCKSCLSVMLRPVLLVRIPHLPPPSPSPSPSLLLSASTDTYCARLSTKGLAAAVVR